MNKFQFIKNLSIKNKIIAIVLFVSLTVVSVGFVFIATWDIDRLRSEIQSNLMLDAKLIGDYCIVPLTFGDNRQAQEALSRLKYLESVEAGFLFDEAGNLFAKYPDTLTAASAPDISISPNAVFKNGYFYITEPVYFQGKVLGKIYIKANSKSLELREQKLALTISILVLVLFLFSYLLAVRMQKFISAPIIFLKDHFNKIATTQDYSTRVTKPYNDETGNLYDGFNELLGTIDAQNQEKKRLIYDLSNSRSMLNTILDTIPQSIFWKDKNSVYLGCNKAFADSAGIDHPDLIIGKTDYDLPWKREAEKYRDDDQEVITSGRAKYHIIEPLLRADGKDAWVDTTKIPLIDSDGKVNALLGVLEDITERKRTEAQLAESEQKYRELVEHANSIILRWTSDGEITFMNEFGQRFFGYSPDEILGRHVVGTIVPTTESGGRELEQLMEQICAHPEAFEQNINENMRRDGERVWIAWTNRIVLDAQGQVSEIFSVGTDITERKQTEEELQNYRIHLEEMVKERTTELVIAKERAESADRLKSAFLATMWHELRTPLNSIIGFTGILIQGLAGPLNTEQTKQLGMVQNSAHHLLALINDVLDISKIEAGQLEVTLKCFDFRKSIEKIISSIQPLTERKGLELQTSISAEVNDLVSDSRRVEQILLNLLNNAIKFTEKGSIHIECKIVGKKLVTSVIDTGIGIRDEDLEKLFKPFSQIDTGTTRSYEGTGLGLSISKRLVEKLGGNITVQSKLGTGSTFRVALPIIEG